MATITEDEIYKIRTDILCNYFGATKDPDIKRLIADFLSYKGKWKRTSELYLEFLSRHSDEKAIILSKLQDRETWEKEDFLTAKCARSMVSQLLRWPDTIHDGAFNWHEYYFFGLEDEYLSPANGVILNQPVEAHFPADREFFTKFFIFMFSKEEHPDNFLAYHRINTFRNDVKQYRRFLKDCLDQLMIRKAFLKQWIKDELNATIQPTTVANVSQPGSQPQPLSKLLNEDIKDLSDIFINKDDFEKYVKLLKDVEPPVIDDNNRYILGKNSKGALVAWVYALQRRSKIKSIKDATLSNLLVSHFQMDSFDERTLRANPTKAYNQYFQDFLALTQ